MITIPAWVGWGAGLLLPAAIAWAIRCHWLISENQTALKRLLWMHNNADQTGFGTVGFREAIDNNTRVMRELVHYMKWMARQSGHDDPPPFVGGHDRE